MVANIENAFKFVFRDRGWIIKLFVGGVLLIIPVVNFIVLGYLLNILKDAKEGKEARLPEFAGWGALFKEGVNVFLVGLVYSLIIFAIWLITTLISLIPVVGCLGFILFPVLIVAMVLLSPAVNIGLCRYLDKGILQEAFKLNEIFEEFKSKLNDYAVATLLYAGIAFIASLTFCIAPFIMFWLCLVMARMFGEIYGTRPTKISA